jgi:hypothetical protein
MSSCCDWKNTGKNPDPQIRRQPRVISRRLRVIPQDADGALAGGGHRETQSKAVAEFKSTGTGPKDARLDQDRRDSQEGRSNVWQILRPRCGVRAQSVEAVSACRDSPPPRRGDSGDATVGNLRLDHERRLVDQNSASWNRITVWLNRIQALQTAA